jgi:hypothetical protein
LVKRADFTRTYIDCQERFGVSFLLFHFA